MPCCHCCLSHHRCPRLERTARGHGASGTCWNEGPPWSPGTARGRWNPRFSRGPRPHWRRWATWSSRPKGCVSLFQYFPQFISLKSTARWKLLLYMWPYCRIYLVYWNWKSKSLSHVGLFATPWTIQYPGIESSSPSLQADALPAEPPGKPKNTGVASLSLLQQIFPAQEDFIITLFPNKVTFWSNGG